MVNNRSVWKAIAGASFLVTLTLILLFFYFQTLTPNNRFFPEDTERWNQIYTTYIVSFTLILIVGVIIAPKEVKALATANYWKSFGLKFIPNAILTVIILFLIKAIIKGVTGINPLLAIGYLPISVLITHLFLVSQIEEIMFGGITYESVRVKYGDRPANIITMGAFSVFHYAKTNSIIATVIYIPLRYWWNYLSVNGTPFLNRYPKLRRFFGATPRTQQNNAGSHFGWNAFASIG